MTRNPDPRCPVHKTTMEFCDGSYYCETCWEEWEPTKELMGQGKEHNELRQNWLLNIPIVKEK